jgi:hypothetical protein
MGAGVALATRFGNLPFTTVGYAAFLPPSTDDKGISLGDVGGFAVLARMPSG